MKGIIKSLLNVVLSTISLFLLAFFDKLIDLRLSSLDKSMKLSEFISFRDDFYFSSFRFFLFYYNTDPLSFNTLILISVYYPFYCNFLADPFPL